MYDSEVYVDLSTLKNNTFYFLPIKCFLVFFSGLNKIIKHFGKNIQIINPKLEAKMANTSTATVNFPGELI